MTNVVSASAPGKIILTGEHFVVNGAYSLAAALDKRVRVSISEVSDDSYIISGGRKSRQVDNDGRFRMVKSIMADVIQRSRSKTRFAVSISSQIPSGSGLGSSAAVSVATSAAALKFFRLDTSPESVFETALNGEKKVHGNPSGIDVEASIKGGMVLFSKTVGAKSIPMERALHILVIYTGKARKTGILISKVREKKRRFPSFFERLTSAASFMSLGMLDAISCGDLPRLGAFMNISQTALNWIGVSTPYLERMLEEVAALGVFGVKLTGAGGGGSIIVLPKPDTAEEILRIAQRNSAWAFITQIPQEGFKIE